MQVLLAALPLFANYAITAYLLLRRGLLVRPPHSAIADCMARRSLSGIPADPSASESGQPVRPRRRCFGGAEDSGRGNGKRPELIKAVEAIYRSLVPF
jgi:hypothetical protein